MCFEGFKVIILMTRLDGLKMPKLMLLKNQLSGRAATTAAHASQLRSAARAGQLHTAAIVPAFAARWQQIPPNYVNLKCDFFYKVKVS
jgi:hypothetical protein